MMSKAIRATPYCTQIQWNTDDTDNTYKYKDLFSAKQKYPCKSINELISD